MRRTFVWLATALFVGSVVVVGSVGLVGAADDPDPGAGDPAPPSSPAPPAGRVRPLTVVDDVDSEADYLAALAALSADPNGPHTINITGDFTITTNVDPQYSNATESLTINGNGHTVNAGGNSRFLFHNTTADLAVNDLTVEDGASSNEGGVFEANGNATVSNSTFRNNSATFDGGAVDTDGLLTIVDSSFLDNAAGNDGGAADTSTDGDIVASGSTFAGNTAGNEGGALEAEGSVTLTNSTVTDNTGAEDVLNAEDRDVTLTHVTYAANDGGTSDVDTDAGATLTLFGTVLANPLGGPLCSPNFGSVVSSYSYDTDGSCGLSGAGDTSGGGDPLLGPLQDNGGPTQTRAIGTDSPLFDAIPPADCDPAVTTDQRGVERPQFDGCDIGAFELAPAAEPIPRAPTFTG